MSCLEEINQNQCAGIDAQKIKAYFDLSLDEEDPTTLNLDTSWGMVCTNLTPAIKASETITHLLLTDTALQYNREDYGREGAENDGIDCIEGDALSRIISMTKLKDVSQTSPIMNGGVYMWDGSLFQPFDLQTFVNQTNQAIASLNSAVNTLKAQVAGLQQQVNNLDTRVTNNSNAIQNILSILAKPQGIPANSRLVWGTDINLYGDYTNTNNHQHGFFTHSISNDVNNDLYFA